MGHTVTKQLESITQEYSFPIWEGDTDVDTYGGKTLLDYQGQPVFAEIYALKLLKTQGYRGFWIDNYRKRLVEDMSLANRIDDGRYDLEAIKKINEGKVFRSGNWDLYVWNG